MAGYRARAVLHIAGTVALARCYSWAARHTAHIETKPATNVLVIQNVPSAIASLLVQRRLAGSPTENGSAAAHAAGVISFPRGALIARFARLITEA